MGAKKKSQNGIPKGTATRRRKESGQADSNVAASTSSASLIEAAQQEEDKNKRKRPSRELKARDTDEQADRIMDKNFGHLSKVTQETKTVDGKTLRERVKYELRSVRDDDLKDRLSHRFWQPIVEQYAAGESLPSSLVVKDKTEKCSPNFGNAVDAATRTCFDLL
jgi:hypothetical protein